MKIIVLAGGLSPERDVSLSSGALISNALMENGHDVMLLDLFLGTENKIIEPKYRNKSDGYKYSYFVPEVEPNLESLKGDKVSMIGEGVIKLCSEADIVFMGLHGSIGENGQLQGLFDINGIKYTGTGYVGSLLAMDKDISKKLFDLEGVLTPRWKCAEGTCDDISFPCVVKPCSCGSSVGVTIVQNKKELLDSIELARKYEGYVIVEEKIEGREFSVGILGGKALPVIEIKPIEGFYDYKNKYQKGLTNEICPADITENIRDMLQAAAEKVHNVLRLGFYSRVDFILDSENRAFCLEANTLPGMTPTSLLPQEALASGISYNELCERIARGA